MCVQRESMADGSGSEVSSSAVTNLLRDTDTSQRNTARWYEGVHKRRPSDPTVILLRVRTCHIPKEAEPSLADEVGNWKTGALVKAVRGMNVQICTKASNLVHRYILTRWTQICREPKPIFNGVAILEDSKWPPSVSWTCPDM